MLISIILCTYNRSEGLNDVLDSLLDQKLGAGLGYEVVIVNNNSSDNTKQVIDSYLPKFHGKLRYFFEGKQGKPYALNLGIKESKGEVLAFTDDDCFLEKDYIMNVYETFRATEKDIGFAGGRIFPKWIEGAPPEWLNQFYPQLLTQEIKWEGDDKPGRLDEFFLGPIGILNYGDKPFVMDYAANEKCDKLFYGANMAIRREALQKHGFFDLKKTLSQDSEICLRLLKEGVKGLYSPQLVVYHKIKVSKITFDFYYHWYALRGKFDTPEFPPKRKFYHPLGVPWSMIGKTLSAFRRSQSVSLPYQKTFYSSNMIYNWGQIMQIAKKNII